MSTVKNTSKLNAEEASKKWTYDEAQGAATKETLQRVEKKSKSETLEYETFYCNGEDCDNTIDCLSLQDAYNQGWCEADYAYYCDRCAYDEIKRNDVPPPRPLCNVHELKKYDDLSIANLENEVEKYGEVDEELLFGVSFAFFIKDQSFNKLSIVRSSYRYGSRYGYETTLKKNNDLVYLRELGYEDVCYFETKEELMIEIIRLGQSLRELQTTKKTPEDANVDDGFK